MLLLVLVHLLAIQDDDQLHLARGFFLTFSINVLGLNQASLMLAHLMMVDGRIIIGGG